MHDAEYLPDGTGDRPWVDRALVTAWRDATDEHKADPLRYGPWTREATAAAFRNLGLDVPRELDA